MSATDLSFNLSENKAKTVVASYKYLDIDSTYRNRNDYPNQNNFVVPISYPGRGSTASSAVDPVSNSLPYTNSSNPIGSNLLQATSVVNNIVFLDAAETTIDNFYINSYLEIAGEFRKIIAYDGTTQTATVSPGFSFLPAIGTSYYTRKSIPSFVGTVAAFPAPTLTSFSLAAAPSFSQLVGNYVRFYPSAANPDLIFLITGYDSATNTVTVSSMPNIPVAGDALEIDLISKDNAATLIYSGLEVNSSQNSYYEIELLWLSVPNVVLGNGYGGKFDRYPYIYLHLYNEGKRLYNQPMYSNNPKSTLALFKIPINNYFGATAFITLTDAFTKQVVKFETAQDIRFTLTLPDGTVPEYYETDKTSPEEPNPLLQVNALFSLRRLT